jgi:hypothetical protein
MLDPFALDPEFEPWFVQSTALMLGHQRSVVKGGNGFVDSAGTLTIPNPQDRFEHFCKAGLEYAGRVQ